MQTSQEISARNSAHKDSTPKSELPEIEREFNVPVERLFAAFATAEELKTWWWPKDLRSDHVEIDFREGGNYFINMKGFEQGGGGMCGDFEEIVQNKRIVMSDYFADENGNAITAREANMPGDWPRTVFITFDFESIEANRSRLILSQQGIPNEMQPDCIQGWSESFDKLEESFARSRENAF